MSFTVKNNEFDWEKKKKNSLCDFNYASLSSTIIMKNSHALLGPLENFKIDPINSHA